MTVGALKCFVCLYMLFNLFIFFVCFLFPQWWRTDGSHAKRVLLKGTFGKYIRFSPDFMTFVTIDNAGLLYILTSLTG